MRILIGFFVFYLFVISNSFSSIENSGLNKIKNKHKGWSYCFEVGVNYKNLKEIKNLLPENAKIPFGHKGKEQYWGEFGYMISPWGFKYQNTFLKKGYWSIKIVQSFFYPDTRWEKGAKSDITLSSIPIIGSLIKINKDSPAYLTMLIPIIYFDLGYITDNDLIFKIGSVYLWGLAPSITIPIIDHFNIELRTVFFLDKYFFDKGYHNFLFNLSLEYKF